MGQAVGVGTPEGLPAVHFTNLNRRPSGHPLLDKDNASLWALTGLPTACCRLKATLVFVVSLTHRGLMHS